MPDFQGDLIIAVLDGLVFVIIAAVLGYFINKWLKSFQANLDLGLKSEQAKLDRKLQIAKEKLPAMQRLWDLTKPLNIDRTDDVTGEELIKLRKDLTDWYYTNGSGIFLSDRERTYWRYARSILTEDHPLEEIKDVFSMFRTIVKWKLDIYNEAAASPEIERKVERKLELAEAWAKSIDKKHST